ncbi:hypothetical protein HJC23_012970 [Cyclotella cryptica]|uniref:Peptidase S54 rhomboid domain-containing protein n=1 Tax=Cyclotella cryptica TaxID=29204 RepID=A0ABD3QNC4_9STRA|eukprot:CCRYP_005549-RA/>CCRYP_005549-RA protein AED:0.02 eAED:0.02 QI:307/1/1/1/1/1/2/1069/510
MRTIPILAAVLPLHQPCTAFRSPHSSSIVDWYYACKLGRRHSTNSRYIHASNRKNDQDDDDEDGGINHEEWLRADAPIDFSDLENKILDKDAINYGCIRAREVPRKSFSSSSVEPLTEKEMELYNRRIKMQRREEKRRRIIQRFFPWLSPATSFFIPRRYSYGETMRVADKYVRRNLLSGPNSGRNVLVLLNIVAYLYQIITAVQYLPGFNRILASSIADDAVSAASLAGNAIPQWTRAEVVLRALGIVGGGTGVVISSRRGIAAHSMGPFFIDFAHQPYPLSHYQKHRYLTSGFLHWSLIHLGMNLRALLSLPTWLENGIGKGVYISAYLVSIVTGNVAHTLSTLGELPGRSSSSLCIGASGGICGLYGLMFASLWKMSNTSAAIRVFQQMLWLVAFGWLVPNLSNAAHVGGFIGGCLVGYLFGPGFSRSYSLMRRADTTLDYADPEFRSVMGPGKYPDAYKALIPLKYLWAGFAAAMIIRPDLQVVPIAIVKGILKPGALSNVRSLLL